jgi:hypothetical protein
MRRIRDDRCGRLDGGAWVMLKKLNAELKAALRAALRAAKQKKRTPPLPRNAVARQLHGA